MCACMYAGKVELGPSYWATFIEISVLTSKEISFEKLDSIKAREECLLYSFQMFFIPSLLKASFLTVKIMHIKIVRGLNEMKR